METFWGMLEGDRLYRHVRTNRQIFLFLFQIVSTMKTKKVGLPAGGYYCMLQADVYAISAVAISVHFY